MKVWTDGASSGSQKGIGGWAWVSACGRLGYGSEKVTTNQRMELQAVLDVVTHFPGEDLVIHSDSAYVVNCFHQGWWRGWRKTRYKNGSVANLDLWVPLIDAVVDHVRSVTFVKVKGHSGDRMNDLADKWAVKAKKQQLPTTRRRTVTRSR
jgi:ribonuclease HI